ncbi:MAG: hypothetical protein VCD33_15700 [Alphaproteobacteria bacterium]
MTRRYEVPEGECKAFAETVFDAVSTLHDLTHGGDVEVAPTRISFSQLFAYASDPYAQADVTIEQAIARDPATRADFDRLVEKTSVFIRAAAAASDTTFSRTGEGYRMRFERSRAESTQTYVIIEPTEAGNEPPRALFVRYPDGRRCKHALPQSHGGIVQLLEDAGSELLLGLLDIKNEVYLCRDENQSLSGDDGGAGPN